MTGYRPSSPAVAVELAVFLAATVACGLALTRRRFPAGSAPAWGVLAAATLAAERLTQQEPAGLRMLAICGALFFGMKAVVGAADLSDGNAPLPAGRWLSFSLGWPGMWPRVFARRSNGFRNGGGRLLIGGLLRVLAGAALVGAARLVWVRTGSRWGATALLLPGLSLVLHFGFFNLAAGAWRLAGFPCKPLFRAPLTSRSVAEFWSRRWNLAFTEMIQLSLYRTLAARLGTAAAAFAGFLFSGILHELAITVPARAGYGRPLLYFALQGGMVLWERGRGLAGSGYQGAWIGRLRTLAAIVLPLPILLVPQFLRGAIWPIIGID